MKPQTSQRPDWFEKCHHSDLKSAGGGSAWKRWRAELSAIKRASRKSERARLKNIDHNDLKTNEEFDHEHGN